MFLCGRAVLPSKAVLVPNLLFFSLQEKILFLHHQMLPRDEGKEENIIQAKASVALQPAMTSG